MAEKAYLVKKKYENSLKDDNDKNFSAIFAYNKLLMSSNIDPYYKVKKEAHFKAMGGIKNQNVF